jgi:glycine cleavage system H protein
MVETDRQLTNRKRGMATMIDESKLRYTHSDLWVRREGKRILIGLTDFGQHRLGDAVHVEMPEPDDHHYEAGEDMGVVQSLRTSFEMHAPVSGIITRINIKLLSRPEIVNSDPYGDGWLVEMKPDSVLDVEHLLDIQEYESGLPEEEEE